MATAVLAVLAPGAFAVIDRWTAKAVFAVAQVDRNVAKAAVYRRFAARLAEVRTPHPWCQTIHELDQAVMAEQISLARSPDGHPPRFEIIGVEEGW